MSWLGGWLRELVLVVLMAAFVEMLLPGKSMERYARLVLSLLVLLTMLSPVISLFQGEAGAELTVAMTQQENAGGLFAGTSPGASSLEQILAEGRRLASGAKEKGLELAAAELAQQMQERLNTEGGIKGAKVSVKLALKAGDSKEDEEVPVIAAVEIRLPAITQGTAEAQGQEDTGTGSAASSDPILIEPVEPVNVSLDRTAEEQQAAGAAGETVHPADEADTEAVKRLLRTGWSIEPSVITVSRAGSPNMKEEQ